MVVLISFILVLMLQQSDAKDSKVQKVRTGANSHFHPFRMSNSIFVDIVKTNFKGLFSDVGTSSGLQFWAFQLWPLLKKSVPEAAIHYGA